MIVSNPSQPKKVDDSSKPTFSVLIATYNHQKYVFETLQTVEAQTFKDFEIIIVDDGSTDETESVVQDWLSEFRKRHANRVEYFKTVNRGQSAAFEFGFSYCRGRYICLLDSDDRWLEDKLLRVYETLCQNEQAGMIVHLLYVIDENGNRTGDIRPKGARLSSGDIREQVRATARHVAPATSGVTIRADIFSALLPMPIKDFPSAADLYLTFGASLLAPVHAVVEPLAEYRLHSEGMYIRRMLKREGLCKQVDLQKAVTRPFGLENRVAANSFFARNIFALSKLDAGITDQVGAYKDLVRAVLEDASFPLIKRMQMILFWTACLFAPRNTFTRMWRWFQVQQTGIRNAQGASSPTHPDDLSRGSSVTICGFKVSTGGIEDNLETILRMAESGRGGRVITINLEMISRAVLKPSYRTLLTERTSLIVADGVPVVWVSQLGSKPYRIRGRTNGTDLVARLLARDHNVKLGVVGGVNPKRALDKLGISQEKVPFVYGGIVTLSAEWMDNFVESLNEKQVKILLIALGVPKVDQFADEVLKRNPKVVAVGVGSAFDLLGGIKPRAPVWMQSLGLEWLHRLGTEPRRLWRRYLLLYPIGAMAILSAGLRLRFKKSQTPLLK